MTSLIANSSAVAPEPPYDEPGAAFVSTKMQDSIARATGRALFVSGLTLGLLVGAGGAILAGAFLILTNSY